MSQFPVLNEPTNDTRAEWASNALTAFNKVVKSDQCDVLADLLADLMHWSDTHGHDFNEELDRGRRNYTAEVADEDES